MRHVRKCIGVLDPRCIYTREGLMRFAGLGGESLRLARRAGVRPIEVGRRLYYRGADIVEWIEGHARTPPPVERGAE